MTYIRASTLLKFSTENEFQQISHGTFDNRFKDDKAISLNADMMNRLKVRVLQ